MARYRVCSTNSHACLALDLTCQGQVADLGFNDRTRVYLRPIWSGKAVMATTFATSPSVESRYDAICRRNIRLFVYLAIFSETQSLRIIGDMRLANVMLVLVASGLILLRMRQLGNNLWVMFQPSAALYTVYVGFTAASIIWSWYAAETFVHSATLILLLLTCVSYAHISVRIAAEEVVKAAFAVAVISWLMVPIVPRIAALPDITWRLNGPMAHSQRLALLVSFGLICLTFLKINGYIVWRKSKLQLYYVALLATLFATQTRAFTVFCLSALIFLLLRYVKPTWRLVGLLVIGVVAVLMVVYFDQIVGLLDREGANTMTLTGRTTIWQAAIPLIQENPILGYGFASFATDLTSRFFSSGYIAPHAHNTFINAAFETGLVGASLIGAAMFAPILRGGLSRPSLVGVLMLFSLMCGMTGLIFGGKITMPGILVVTLLLQTEYERSRRRLPVPSADELRTGRALATG